MELNACGSPAQCQQGGFVSPSGPAWLRQVPSPCSVALDRTRGLISYPLLDVGSGSRARTSVPAGFEHVALGRAANRSAHPIHQRGIRSAQPLIMRIGPSCRLHAVQARPSPNEWSAAETTPRALPHKDYWCDGGSYIAGRHVLHAGKERAQMPKLAGSIRAL